jgi:hypothetical protein
MMGSKQIRGAIALAAIAAVAVAPSALAGGGKANTKLTVEFHESAGQPAPHFYTGKVKSKRPACKKGRTVKLKGVSNELISKGKSNSLGQYSLQEPTPAPAGDHTIVAPRTAKCKSAKVTVLGGG